MVLVLSSEKLKLLSFSFPKIWIVFEDILMLSSVHHHAVLNRSVAYVILFR